METPHQAIVDRRDDREGYARLTLRGARLSVTMDIPVSPYNILEGDRVTLTMQRDAFRNPATDGFVLCFRSVRAWDGVTLMSAGGLLLLLEGIAAEERVYLQIAHAAKATRSLDAAPSPMEKRQTRSSRRKETLDRA